MFTFIRKGPAHNFGSQTQSSYFYLVHKGHGHSAHYLIFSFWFLCCVCIMSATQVTASHVGRVSVSYGQISYCFFLRKKFDVNLLLSRKLNSANHELAVQRYVLFTISFGFYLKIQISESPSWVFQTQLYMYIIYHEWTFTQLYSNRISSICITCMKLK